MAPSGIAVPVICLDHLNSNCSKRNCSNIHANGKYLWQSELDGEWEEMPPIHMDELEKEYYDVNSDGLKLTAVDPVSKERFFDDSEVCSVDFDSMKMDFNGIELNVRRISTPSSIDSRDENATDYAWYFKDEHGKWIEYGGTNENEDKKSPTLASSDDLEQEFCREKSQTMEISSKRHTYIVHFQNFVQINKETNVSRPIRRRPTVKEDTQSISSDCSSNSKFEKTKPQLRNNRQRHQSNQQYDNAVDGGHRNYNDIQFQYDMSSNPPPLIPGLFPGPNTPGNFPNPRYFNPGAFQSYNPPNSMRQGDYHYRHQHPTGPNSWTGNHSNRNNSHSNITGRGGNKKNDTRSRSLNRGNRFNNKSISKMNLNFEWQVEVSNGQWELLGKNRKVKPNQLSLSDEIETHYLTTPYKPYNMSTVKNSYFLNLQRGTQTQESNGNVKRIRRIPKTGDVKADDIPIKIQKDSKKEAEIYDWYIMDGNNKWIKYGSAGDHIITSQKLEEHYGNDKQQKVTIISDGVKYVIDLCNNTQINTETKSSSDICRAIRDPISNSLKTNSSLKNDAQGASNDNNVASTSGVMKKSASGEKKCEWYFKDDKNNWVKFGESSGGGTATKLTSDEIEKHYQQTPDKPLNLESPTHKYVLDLKNKTQTNAKTNTVRTIKRAEVDKKAQMDAGSKSFEWFFQDEGCWTKFGDCNVTDGSEASDLTSDDVEKQFQSGSKNVKINVGKNQFTLDLIKMNQTNVKTGKIRLINRAPANTIKSSSVTVNVWYYLDDNDTWVKYGNTNATSVNVSSEEIENFYNEHPDKNMEVKSKTETYELNFKTMKQINKKTKTVRSIRRIFENILDMKKAAASKPKAAPFNPKSEVYEWFFETDQGDYVKFGQPGDPNDPKLASQATSADIERHYNGNPTQPLTIKSAQFEYVLDFTKWTQTNKQTKKTRNIHRVLANKTPHGESSKRIKSERIQWEFLDEHQNWIAYGQISSNKDEQTATTAASDDIEKAYQTDPTMNIQIQSASHSYTIDFGASTQTNDATNTARQIRRVKIDSAGNKSLVSLKQVYEWQFLDAQNVWVKYGGITANNEAITATTVDSDFIEQEYAKDPTQTITIQSNKFSYKLDFQNLTQTNVKTNVVRKIQRVASTTQIRSPPKVRASASPGFPQNWTNVDVNKLTTVPLAQSDVDYQKILNLITKTLGSRPIIKIVRIQHPHLWQAFICEKNNLKSQFPSVTYNEMYLFHGTNHANIQSICLNNFDWRRAGTSVGTAYGHGIYFSNNATVSDGYSKGQPKCIFIARVIVGQTFQGSGQVRIPPPGCDTAVNNTSNPSYFIKFEKNECYPEFYVEYQ